MCRPLRSRLLQVVQDRRGVALPLALIGLVAVSLMVTTALVTSSTEAAISTAHQDATRALYVAEGGLQAYVAQNGVALTPGQVSINYVPPGGTAADAVVITPTHLGDRAFADGSMLRMFSVASRAVNNGAREVVAMLRQVFPPPVTFNTNVQSAITLGGDMHVAGNAFTVNGRLLSSDTCATRGVAAVHHTQESDINVNNPNHWKNFKGVDEHGNLVEGRDALKESDVDKEAMLRDVLGLEGGMTLDDLIAMIPSSKKWGPKFSPEGGPLRVFDGRVDPGEEVAVVDANGGYVDLYGVEGLLIVVNGHLRMRGNSTFNGIIIVEGHFDLAGTPTVRGALISLDDSDKNIINLDESAIGAGHITVQYDACMIRQAEQAFSNISQQQPPTVGATLSWMEVVR